jgi:hypothetical protein
LRSHQISHETRIIIVFRGLRGGIWGLRYESPPLPNRVTSFPATHLKVSASPSLDLCPYSLC